MHKLVIHHPDILELMFAILTYIKHSVFPTAEEDLVQYLLNFIFYRLIKKFIILLILGIGPIGVKAHLKDFLPSHSIVSIGGNKDIAIAAAPFSSALILPISYSYILQLGKEGLKQSTAYAILNANYLLNKLKNHYKIVFTGPNGRCAHEFIIDIRPFKVNLMINY